VDVPYDILPYDATVKHLVVRICDLDSRKISTKFISKGARPPMVTSLSDGGIPVAIESLDLDHSECKIKQGVDYILDSLTFDLSKLKRLQINIENMGLVFEQHENISRLLRACGSVQILRFIPSTYSE
jgi:hypothetical protein